MLLGGTVHEVTILRGLFGSPEEVLAADTWAGGSAITALMRYPGDLRCTLTHATMPDLKQYTEDLTVYGPDQSVSIQFPSPYLKNTPTWVVSRGMDDGRYWEKRILVSYEESFKEELKHFHDCVVNNLHPRTDGREAKKDIELLVRIARAFNTA
jgi:predicted dehydrogenase